MHLEQLLRQYNMTTDYNMNMYMYRQAYTSVARLLRETDSEKI